MKNFRLVWFATLVCKLLFAAILPLTTDEAYYWVWSERPQLSYFDHPPFVAWLMSLGHCFEGLGNAVRWPTVVIGHLTIAIWILIAQKFFQLPPARRAQYFWLILLSPLIGFGSLIATPDVPVLFFWSGAFYFFQQILGTKELKNYLLLGVCLGLGFCSKYHIVLFLPCGLLYLFCERAWKRLSLRGVLLTVLTGFIFSLPVIIWNFQNDFASFQFQIHHGFSHTEFNWSWPLDYVLGQIILIFPTIVYLALKSKPQGLQRTLLYFAWPPLVFFLFSSLRASVEANWPIISYAPILCLSLLESRKRAFYLASMAFWSVLFAVFLSQQLVPWMANPPGKLMEFTELRDLVKEKDAFSPLYAGSYQMAATFWYTTKSPFFKLRGMSRNDIFDSFPESLPTQNPFYVLKSKDTSLPSWISETEYQTEVAKQLSDEYLVMRVSRR